MQYYSSKTKTNVLKVLHTRKIVHEVSSISVQESLPLCLQRDAAHQKHGTSLFCNIPELLYKVVEFTPIHVGHFSILAKLENPVFTKSVSGIHLFKDILSLYLITSIFVHYIEH